MQIVSTHTLSPRLFVDMICRSMKVAVYFIGVQPAQTQLGSVLSVDVSRAIQHVNHILTRVFPRCQRAP